MFPFADLSDPLSSARNAARSLALATCLIWAAPVGAQPREGAPALGSGGSTDTVEGSGRPEAAPEVAAELEAARLIGSFRFEEALAIIDPLLAATPNEAQPMLRLHRGLALRRLGRFEEALAEYDRLDAMTGPTPRSVAGRAESLLGLGRPREAGEVLNRLEPELLREGLLHDLAMAQWRWHIADDAGAIGGLGQIRTQVGSEPIALRIDAWTALARGDAEAAADALSRLGSHEEIPGEMALGSMVLASIRRDERALAGARETVTQSGPALLNARDALARLRLPERYLPMVERALAGELGPVAEAVPSGDGSPGEPAEGGGCAAARGGSSSPAPVGVFTLLLAAAAARRRGKSAAPEARAAARRDGTVS